MQKITAHPGKNVQKVIAELPQLSHVQAYFRHAVETVLSGGEKGASNASAEHNSLKDMKPGYLKRFLSAQNMSEHYETLMALLYPNTHVLGENMDPKHLFQVGVELSMIFPGRPANAMQFILPSPEASAIFEDIKELLDIHYGVGTGKFLAQWVSFEGFTKHLQNRAELTPYESLIEEYRSDKRYFEIVFSVCIDSENKVG